ncbi:MAG: LPS-assembly protein LptD [Myxococcaceae bacterium]
MLSALAALLVLGQSGLSSLAPPAPDEPIHVKADHLDSDADAQHVTLTGNAQLRTAGTMVHADKVFLDQDTNTLTATGNAYCVSGSLGAVADQLTLDLSTGTLVLEKGHFFEKKKVTLDRLLAAQSASELQSLGQTALAGTADRIQRSGGGHLHMNNLTFTPCDCEPRDPLKPHWSIQSVYADVVLGEGAWMWLAIIRVYDVPVLPLPVMYVPLSDRKTGLLPILPNYSAWTGWYVPVPVYVTLGRSADIETDLGYTTGGANPNYGTKGPSLDTTFRFASSVDTHGTAEFFIVNDTLPPRNPENGVVWSSYTGTPEAAAASKWFGPREQLNSQIVAVLGGGWATRLDLNLASDSALPRDEATDVLSQANQYLTSTFQLSHRSADAWEGLTLSYRQDTQPPFAYSLFGTDKNPATGAPERGPATFQQLPDVTVALPTRPLWGPLMGSLDMSYTRLSPLTQLFGDEGRYGIFMPVAPANPTPPGVVDPLQGDGIYQPAYERQARDRLDVVPRLVMTLPVGDVLRIQPSAWVREDVYVGEISGAVANRAYGVFDLLISSELSRTYGEGQGGLRNAFQPSLEVRDIVGAWGAVPGPQPSNKYDAIDWAVDTNHRLQGVAKFTESLTRRTGAQQVELLRLELAQEFISSSPNGLSDSVASARTTLGAFTAATTFRWDNQRHAPALFSIGAGVQPWVNPTKGARPPQYSFHVEYDFIYLSTLYQNQNGIPLTDEAQEWVGGSAAQRRGIDALVGSPLPAAALQGSLLHTITLTGTVYFPYGLGLNYSGTLYPNPPPLPPNFPTGSTIIGPHAFFGQQQLALLFGPACNCWQLTLGVRTAPGLPAAFPTLFVDFTIAGFGTFGN